jgi:hypothetical protein
MRIRYLLLVFLLVSCKQHERSLYEFDPAKLSENEILLSVIADDIQYTPLENCFPLSNINSAYDPVIVKNAFFIYDDKIGILKFDRDGRFLQKIGSKGRGPGEYVYGNTFTVDERTGSIYVHDINNVVRIYDKSGNFRNSFSLEKYGGAIDILRIFNSSLFVSYNLQFDDAKYEWIILDTLGNLIKLKERTMPIFESNYLMGGGTFIYDQSLNYWNQFIDTVFTFLPDYKYKTNFTFTNGEYRLPKTKIANPFQQLSKYAVINQIFETSKYLTIRYSFYLGKNGLVITDKKSHEAYLQYWKFDDLGCIINDLDYGPKFLPMSYFVENGREYFVGFLDSYQLITRTKEEVFKRSSPKCPEKKKELEKLAAGLKDTDNPVLVQLRLKK